jgi:cobalt-zinc-cadmium efflux system outer membrane protein
VTGAPLPLARILASPLVWPRSCAGLALALGAAWGAPALAASQLASLGEDPVLQAAVASARELRPELERARAALAAERERVPQSAAMPDPTLSVGLQNDGFTAIRIGEMESSYVSVMASQSLPWFGKRDLRSAAAQTVVLLAQADLRRAELSVAAEVERGYVELLLARGQLALLSRLELLWAQSEGLARSRYESGEGSQSDLLRAQLERSRLRQRRWRLEAQEQQRLAGFNRLRGVALGEALETTRSLVEVADPPVGELSSALADAEGRSPEVARLAALVVLAQRQLEVARSELVPDPTVSVGLMVRGVRFEPMWQASVALPLPVWATSKQQRVVAQAEARQREARAALEATRRLLDERVRERALELAALNATNGLYRSGLLVQSEATVTSTLAQYQVGRVTFASVLEALGGYVADVGGFLDSVAAAQRLAIASREVSLDASPGAPMGGGGALGFPGAGGAGGDLAPGAPVAPGGSRDSSSSGMSKM